MLATNGVKVNYPGLAYCKDHSLGKNKSHIINMTSQKWSDSIYKTATHNLRVEYACMHVSF